MNKYKYAIEIIKKWENEEPDVFGFLSFMYTTFGIFICILAFAFFS